MRLTAPTHFFGTQLFLRTSSVGLKEASRGREVKCDAVVSERMLFTLVSSLIFAVFITSSFDLGSIAPFLQSATTKLDSGLGEEVGTVAWGPCGSSLDSRGLDCGHVLSVGDSMIVAV